MRRSMSTRCGWSAPVGVEQVGLWALEQLDLPALLTVNGALRSAATGALVGRLAAPASERATHAGCRRVAVSGSCSVSKTVGAMQLYRASVLVKYREAIEAQARWGCSTCRTVTLYDLTNTYFEGEASSRRRNAGTRRRSAATARY